MTDDSLPQRVDVARRELDQLMRRGRQLRAAPQIDAVRAWQHECAGLVHDLSGGNKGHWLARAYSEAFLVRAGEGGIVIEAPPAEIIDRVLEVLRRADEVLARITSSIDTVDPTGQPHGPSIPRFDFVGNAELRPVLEQAFVDSARALETADYASALMTSCVILEALITDALQTRARQCPGEALEAVSNGNIGEWPFAARIAAAEGAGLIRGGCARLPLAARAYRDGASSDGGAAVSERDARLTRQVLLVVMRDLNPTGR